uniref:Uncharacterized protein n=1 Tax=Parascaris univalens TaxID=6257 RepID=A0A915BIL2_PARUN
MTACECRPTSAIYSTHRRNSTEYGDELSLTNSTVVETNNDDSGIGDATTSSSVERRWNRMQNRIEQFSSIIGKSVPSKFHSRISSEGSRDNSTSSGFSSAQHSPQGSSSLVAYENFLIIDDELIQPKESLVGHRVGAPNRCKGVLRINDEIPLPECSRSDAHSNSQVDMQMRTDKSRQQTSSSESSFWERMRTITNIAISLLPNTVSPNAATVAVLKDPVPRQARTVDEFNEQRMQRIRRYVYIAQAALILIVALLWLASNFIDLKAPNHSDPSQQSINESEHLSPTSSSFHDSIITREDVTQASPVHLMKTLDSTLTALLSPNEMNRRNSTDSLRQTDNNNALNGNRIDEEDVSQANPLWHIYAPEMHQSAKLKKLPNEEISISDSHKIQRR